jgi:uncharacterized protein YndB with AHSA1/START domain
LKENKAMTDTTMSGSIVVEQMIAHPPELVWRVLTDPKLIARWLMENSFQPRLGHRFNFHAKPIPGHWNGTTDCEVIEIDAPSRLCYTWNASGEEAVDGLKSVVTWTLTPTPSGTLLRMEQSGFRRQDETGRQMMSNGWPGILERLATLVAEDAQAAG